MQSHEWLRKRQNEKTRQILFWAHAVVGGAFLCFYLWRTNRPLASAFLPSAGIADLAIGLPSIIPFIAAGAYSRRLFAEPCYITHSSWRLIAYITVLAVGAEVASLLMIAPPGPDSKVNFYLYLLDLGGLYVVAAEFLLNKV